MKRILIVDDDRSTCRLLSDFLNRKGYNAEGASSGKDALNILKKEKYHLILCDYRLSDMLGKEAFEKIKFISPGAIVIFITGYGNVQTAVDMMKTGAYYYLEKPLQPEKILELIENALSPAFQADEEKFSKPHLIEKRYIRGKSEAAIELYQQINLVAPTNYSVVIMGETGTGKESLARMIHSESKRSEGPFIPVDCGSLSRELASSELFGHEKGAFTGAVNAKTGAFELACKGTIFLDEIANLPYDVQALLLRAIQEKCIRKVGGIKEVPVDVRLITASNKSLDEAVSEKRFRDDLLHRLNEFTLVVPSLRERKDDIKLFVEEFVRQAETELDKNITGVPEQIWDLLYKYPWPGNIRQLKNVVRKACLLTPNGRPLNEKVIQSEVDLLSKIRNYKEVAGAQAAADEKSTNLKKVTQDAEYNKIIEVLEKVKYNKTKAATLLNIDRKTLYNKLNQAENK